MTYKVRNKSAIEIFGYNRSIFFKKDFIPDFINALKLGQCFVAILTLWLSLATRHKIPFEPWTW